MTSPNARTALDIADWRRHVFALYDSIRSASDPETAHDTWRRRRNELFKGHPASPILDREVFTALPIPPYDPAWRFTVTLQAPRIPRSYSYETGTDGVVPFALIGIADVPGVGSLDVWKLMSYGGGIFVPVRDGSAGKYGGTYGGGRYLIDTVKGADLGHGKSANDEPTMILDFNFAYNPSCAYDPTWACPLAPEGNRVAVDIPVGEMYSS